MKFADSETRDKETKEPLKVMSLWAKKSVSGLAHSTQGDSLTNKMVLLTVELILAAPATADFIFALYLYLQVCLDMFQ